jgi:hypothetical protein
MQKRTTTPPNSKGQPTGAIVFDENQDGWLIEGDPFVFASEEDAFNYWHGHYDPETGKKRS